MGNIYGKLNIPIMQKEYVGIKTGTTTTKVNNQSNVISVDINEDLLNKINNLEQRIIELEQRLSGGEE